MSSCPGQRSHPRTHKGGRCPRAPRRSRPPGPPQGKSQARGESALSTASHQTPTERPTASAQTTAASRWRSLRPSGAKNDPEVPRDHSSFFLTLPSAADLSPSKGSTGKYSVWRSAEQVGVQALGRFFLWDTVTAADSLGFRWHCPGFSQNGTVPVPHMRSLKPFLIRSIILPKWTDGTKTNPDHPLHLEQI